MASLRPDLTSKIWLDPSSYNNRIDHFDELPETLLLLILNKIADVKTLGRCAAVSRRFQTLVPEVEHVLVRVDCVISDDDSGSVSSAANKARGGGGGSLANLFRFIFGGIAKPIHALGQLLGPKRAALLSSPAALAVGNGCDNESMDQGGVTHHSPTQVLKSFTEIRFLKIELPSGELGIDGGVLLKWRANFGSTLDSCVILGASSLFKAGTRKMSLALDVGSDGVCGNGGVDDNGSIPESFYTNGGLKLRVVWTISSLIAASARHYLLQPIIAEHRTLERLVMTDSVGQGELCMNRVQLEELRVRPLSASSASKRTLVPALSMRLWYAPHLEMPNGIVLKGATLVAIRPSEQSAMKEEVSDSSWVSSAFEEEPDRTAAKMLLKRRTYCLEMNSF